jgi:hypothetical protein
LILAPVDPNTNPAADADPERRDRVGRMAAAALRPAPLSLDDALTVREQKIEQVMSHAEAIHDQWGRTAYLYLVKFCRGHRKFIGHDVVEASRAEIEQPHDTRAWGGVFQRALKVGCIERIGYQPAPHRHASPSPEYRSLIWSGLI